MKNLYNFILKTLKYLRYYITILEKKLSVKIESVADTNEDKVIIFTELIYKLSMGLIAFIKNKIPSWLKSVILIIISFICLNYSYKYIGLSENENTSSILLSNIVLVKSFFILGSIISLIMICYYIFHIYFYIMFSKDIINMPILLPQFILDKLEFIYKISKTENKGLYIEFYFRLIFVYILILFLTLFVLLLIM